MYFKQLGRANPRQMYFCLLLLTLLGFNSSSPGEEPYLSKTEPWLCIMGGSRICFLLSSHIAGEKNQPSHLRKPSIILQFFRTTIISCLSEISQGSNLLLPKVSAKNKSWDFAASYITSSPSKIVFVKITFIWWKLRRMLKVCWQLPKYQPGLVHLSQHVTLASGSYYFSYY